MDRRERFKGLLPIIKAYTDGESIEWLSPNNRWIAQKEPDFHDCASKYRISLKTKEPQYRPYTTEEAMQIVGRTVHKNDGGAYSVTGCDIGGVIFINGRWMYRAADLLTLFTIDGKPCGVFVEE